jgi:hypothetical protein
MTFPETSYMKNVVNELSFPLATHMTCFNIWFGHYDIFEVRFQFWADSGQIGYTGA